LSSVMSKNIHIIPNIITPQEADFYIKYIDLNINNFSTYSEMGNPKRHAWRFGVDEVWTDSNPTLEKIPDIHEELRILFNNVVKQVKLVYDDPEDLYVTSFHLGKQLPGAVVARHLDAGENDNGHFKYSFILYLNANSNDGTIRFNALDYSYTPESCAAIVFPSKGEEYEHQVDTIENARYSLPMWITANPEYKIKFSQ
jgi:hypothetical protein